MTTNPWTENFRVPVVEAEPRRVTRRTRLVQTTSGVRRER